MAPLPTSSAGLAHCNGIHRSHSCPRISIWLSAVATELTALIWLSAVTTAVDYPIMQTIFSPDMHHSMQTPGCCMYMYRCMLVHVSGRCVRPTHSIACWCVALQWCVVRMTHVTEDITTQYLSYLSQWPGSPAMCWSSIEQVEHPLP